MRPRSLSLVLCLAVFAPAVLSADSLHSTPLQFTLSNGVVSQTDDGRTVVSFATVGDFRGLLTLRLDPARPDGTSSGEWGFDGFHAATVVTEDAPADVPPGGDQDHEYMSIVNRGTLGGAVASAVVTRDAQGTVVGIDDVQLSIGTGSVTFDGATGSGSLHAAGLADAATTDGGLTFDVVLP